jgi:hypothetical protein
MATVKELESALLSARRAFKINPTVDVGSAIERMEVAVKQAVKGMRVHTYLGWHLQVDTKHDGAWFVPCMAVQGPNWLKEGVGVRLDESSHLHLYFSELLIGQIPPPPSVWAYVTSVYGFCARYEKDGDGTKWYFNKREASVLKQLALSYGRKP